MSLLVLILFPGLVLLGGLAVDVTQLNAQKSYVQGQADLAAQSAAGHLHDLDEARGIARAVMAGNTQYGEVSLADSDIVFGRFEPASGFVASIDQTDATGVNAVEVTVKTPWRTLLWAPIISEENYVVSRHAVAVGGPPVVSFTLRNRLLSLDTRDSALLDPLLGSLLGSDALGLDLSVLSYEDLLDTNVEIADLLDLVTLDTALDLVTFEELLNLTLAPGDLVGLLIDEGALDPGVLDGTGIPGGALALNEILTVQPELTQLRVGNVLPNLTVNAVDLLLVTAGLAGFSPAERLEVDAGLDLSPLSNVELETGLIRAPSSFVTRFDEDNLFTAEISQADIDLRADVASLLDLSLSLSAATAAATLTDLNCDATDPGDIVATFSVVSAPAALGIDLALLSPINGNDAAQSPAPISIAGHTQIIDIRLDQVGEPVPVPGVISLANLSSSLSSVLSDLESDLETQRSSTQNNCGFLGCILGSVLGQVVSLLNSVITQVGALLAAPVLEGLAEALLDLLGIDTARAEIILDDYYCAGSGSTLVN
ncbi:MAG: pilus assembly protein TadG-related protein [Silicimonas sp.]|uniref:pilus assembly protein TadG-related protein n=1 Tax=Roseovarius sp. TaxID=1486281 RepID=UPI0032EFA658